MLETIENTKKKLESTIHVLHEKLSTIIATGANPLMLKNIEVEYYGSMTPLNQISNIKTPDASMIIVTPFERSIIKDIVNAIHKSDLGLNPVDEGESIRIMVPPMTAEKREIFVKEAKSIGEEARISVRNIRTDSNKKIKSLKLSENEEKQSEEEIQKLIDNTNKEIENIVKIKVEALTKI